MAHRVYIATFHSFAEDMIKRHGEYFPHRIGARLISPVEQIQILETIVDTVKTHYFSIFRRRESTLKAISFALSKIKNEGLNPGEFKQHIIDQFDIDCEHPDMFYKRKYGKFNAGDIKPTELRKLGLRRDKNLELSEIYQKYQETLMSKNLFDFSDVIIELIHGLEDSDSLLKTELQEQFQYILVDEHQDTNDAQNTIVHGLIDNPVWEGKPNIFVVGDNKQAIFRFAGASDESYNRLLGKLVNPVTINLEQNYRSGQTVLDHAHSLIVQSEHHKNEKSLESFHEYDSQVSYREFQDYKMENLWVVQDIKKRIDAKQDVSEIAVLYRNNKDADDIRRLCDVLGIPYQDFSKKNILKDSDILKLFLILKSIYNSMDNESLSKTLFIDFLGFDVFDIQKIILKSKNAKGEYNKSIFGIISDESKLKDLNISQGNIQKLIFFSKMLSLQKVSAENRDFLSFFSDCVREVGFLKYILGQANSVLGLHKLEKLFNEIKKESHSRTHFGFDDFIHYLNTLQKHGISMNITNSIAKGIQLMTFHGSKGLEFEVVYIIRALQKRAMGNEISLPFREFSDGTTDDERRLFYVAITRAKKECLISSHIFNEEGREKNRSLHINEMKGINEVNMFQWEQEHVSDVALYFNESQGHITSLLDAKYIQEQFLKNKLSVSALNNYIESPLKYFFRNLIFLPEARSPFLDFGNLMHETLEHFFNKVKEENQILSIEELKQSFDYVIQRNHLYEEYAQKGWEMAQSYYLNYNEIFEIPVDNELRVPALSLELKNGQSINLTGVVDKITRDSDGNITVWDYKTGRSYSSMDKGRKEKIKRQAAFYKLLLQNAFDGKYNFHTATFDFLEINEEKGIYERQSFDITQDDVNEVIDMINDLADDVLNGTLLEKDFYRDKETNKGLLEFLEVLRGPVTKEQLGLFD
jgi:DNA helicase-2/ATP-dependent DNA helicase PcrA